MPGDTVFLIDRDGKSKIGNHECSACQRLFEGITLTPNYTEHYVCQEFKDHAEQEHGGVEFREPTPGIDVVRVPGLRGFSMEKYRVSRVDKNSKQAFLGSLDGRGAYNSAPIPWAFLSYSDEIKVT